MTAPRLLVAVLVALVVLAGCAAGPTDDGGPPMGERAGFSPGAGLLSADPATLAADLDAIRAAGGRWVRVDVDWSVTELTPGGFDFSTLDRVIGAAAERDLKVLGLITYTPDWARPAGADNHHPPFDPAAMAQFALVAGERWGEHVDAWEVWNEPNLGDFWSPRADAVGYARLLRAVVPALRQADPGTPILLGGLAPAVTGERDTDPVEYLRAVYADGAGALVDGVAVHPYSFPARPDAPLTASWNTFRRLPELHEVMVEYGHGDRGVWLTEYGAPTGDADQAVDPETQAELIGAGLEGARSLPWVEAVFVYSVRDSGSDPADREQNFGVLTVDGTPKPAWDVVRDEFARGWGR